MTSASATIVSAPAPPAPSAVGGDVVVKCANLTKIFRDFWLRPKVRAVDGINLDVQRGEVFGLLGPNGSGKSTTIKLILGLLHPTAGRIAVFGRRPDDVATKKQIGYLPEESYLYRFLDARETLDYYGRLFHQARGQRHRRIDMLLEMVGLQGVQHRPVGEYSKGMQRRIGLAQALINDPALLILDEPTTGLDPLGTRQIKDLILELARRGKTVLLCSHLLADVEDVCSRVAIMFGGKIRALGTVDELLTRQDATTLQTSLLDPQTIAEVERILTERGQRLERVEQPRQKLETLFLHIIQQAQAEGVVTSGAASGGRIAEFLVGPAPAEGAALIDELSRRSGPAASTLAPVAAAAAGAAAAPAAPADVDRYVIDNLLTSNRVAAGQPASPPAAREAHAGGPQAPQPPVPVPAAPAAHPPPDRFEPPPTEEEAQLINQLVSQSWLSEKQPRQAPAPVAAPADSPSRDDSGAAPAAPPPDRASAGPRPAPGAERPDPSFIDAVRSTPAAPEPPPPAAPPEPRKPGPEAKT